MITSAKVGATHLDGRYAATVALASFSATAAGLAFGVSQHLTIGDPLPWRITATIATAAATIFTIDAMKKWQCARRSEQPRPTTSASVAAGALPAPAAMLALPAPKKPETVKSEDARPKAAPPPPDPRAAVESERARLQAAGFSDPEISQILVARETGGGYAARGAFGSGLATGLLNNLDAVVSHVRSLLPGFKADFERVLDDGATAGTRAAGALSLAVKVLAIVVIGYFVYLEALQFRASAYKAWAEACIERQKNAINFSTMNELMSGTGPDSTLDQDCKK